MSEDNLNTEQDRIKKYLLREVQDGTQYFKSKHIGSDIGLTSKIVGTNIKQLQENINELDISKWSSGDSTCSRRSPRPQGANGVSE